MLDEVTFNTLLKGCALLKMFDLSLDLLDLMIGVKLKPNQVTFNSMIEICVRCGKIDEAWSFLTKMRYSGIQPDNFTLSSLIKGIQPCRDYWNQNGKFVSCQNEPRAARAIFLVSEMHRRPQEFGEKPDEVLYNCLLDMCVRFKDV